MRPILPVVDSLVNIAKGGEDKVASKGQWQQLALQVGSSPPNRLLVIIQYHKGLNLHSRANLTSSKDTWSGR